MGKIKLMLFKEVRALF